MNKAPSLSQKVDLADASTRAIHEALRLMRIGLDPRTPRCVLASEALAQLEALEREIQKAVKAGDFSTSTVLNDIATGGHVFFVVATTDKGRGTVKQWWRVSSEQEARDVAETQSACEGQRSWVVRVYRGDSLLCSYRDGKERSRMFWTPETRLREEERRPSKIGAVCYSVTIRTETGVLRDVVPVESKEAALAYHATKWREATYRTCTFRAYEQTPSGQRTLLGMFSRGRELKK